MNLMKKMSCAAVLGNLQDCNIPLVSENRGRLWPIRDVAW